MLLNTSTRKLAYCVVMMAGSGLKSAEKKKKVTYSKQTAMHRQGNYMMNASQQDSAFHKFGTGLTLL
jgi:hypothetical protein